MINSWKKWAKSLKTNLCALYLAARDPRVPWTAKVVIGLIVAYALSPIDIIPDFVPVFGYIDDLILLPLGIVLAIKLIPKQVWSECFLRAKSEKLNDLPKNWKAAAVIVVIWITSLFLICLFLFSLL
jgi:uncharacterized membrane protein YkvA (DUF1232 family)